jgi:hypothetical protein
LHNNPEFTVATDPDFEAYWNSHRATDTDMAARLKELGAKFPSHADKLRYFEWTDE